jgi:predicted DNA-binding mobile mystery protein A
MTTYILSFNRHLTILRLSSRQPTRTEFQDLRLKQLDRGLAAYRAARATSRPPKGWIRALRQALGISSGELARRLGTSRQLPLQIEKAEAEDRITLKSLRAAANALDCDLVYALVPRADTMQELIEGRVRTDAQKHVIGVEHSMALENQAVGNIDEAVEAETRRIVRKR